MHLPQDAPRSGALPAKSHSGLYPASFSNAVFVSTSALMKAANSFGPRAVGTMPSEVVVVMKAGSLETSAMAEASLSTMGSGVSLGAHTPYHELKLKSFNPTSAEVGMLGASCVRSFDVTNRPRALPDVAIGSVTVHGSMKSCTLPAIRSVLAGAVPL